MKKVIIALDFNPSAQKVAEEGFALARSCGAEITLVHVRADPQYYSSVEHIKVLGFTGLTKGEETILPEKIDPDTISSEFLEKVKQHLGNDDIKLLVVGGSCAEALVETAKNLKSDMLVIGSHSRRWFEHNSLGSIAEKVLLNSSIPVLVIPTNKSY